MGVKRGTPWVAACNKTGCILLPFWFLCSSVRIRSEIRCTNFVLHAASHIGEKVLNRRYCIGRTHKLFFTLYLRSEMNECSMGPGSYCILNIALEQMNLSH